MPSTASPLRPEPGTPSYGLVNYTLPAAWRERQEQLVSQQEVTRQAERAAEDIIEDARAREREIRLGAEDYADEILNTLEVNLSKFIAAVQRGRERLQGKDERAEVA